MIVNVPCEVIFRYTCAVCGIKEDVSLIIRYRGYEVQDPNGPNWMWRLFENAWLCEKHQLQINVAIDGNSGRFIMLSNGEIKWAPDKPQKAEHGQRMIEI